MLPTVSVIIPCYNCSSYLSEAIESAWGQTYPHKEIIVVNDGSTDESRDVMAAYTDRIKVIHQSNAGLPAARNAGIQASMGDFLAFLDADDWWDCTFLEKTVDVLNAHDTAVLAYTGWQNVGAPPPFHEPFIPEDYEDAKPSKIARLLRSTGWPVHAALTRRDAILSAGLFNPALTSCEDFDLWLRVALKQPIVRVPEVLAYYRFHQGQMTRKLAHNAITHHQIQKQFIQDHADFPEFSSKKFCREITVGELMKRAYRAYWTGNTTEARIMFRHVMRHGYGLPHNWKYMLPALLPERIHLRMVKQLRKSSQPGKHQP